MENRINVAELLKDCPKGMELDCTVYDNVTLEYVCKSNSLPICVRKQDRGTMFLSKYGQFHDEPYCKCIIFPKGKTTWEGFHRPFKDGDIVATKNGLFIGIVKVKNNNRQINTYCAINASGLLVMNMDYYFDRFATEEERQKLFKAIKDNGYKWNAETKTLEELIEPKFKAPNKFDITTLKPFDKVLTRIKKGAVWGNDFFGYYKDGWFYSSGHIATLQCIPYEGNEHLLGKTDDCSEYYKTWK